MLKEFYPVLGEFCLAMGSVDAAADEVLFYSVSAYGKKIRDLSIVPHGKVNSRTFQDYPHRFPDKCRFVDAISDEVISQRIDKRSVFPEGLNFIQCIDETYELRNAVFHGQHVGLDDKGNHVFRRAIITGKEHGKKKFDHLNFNVSASEVEILSNFLRMTYNFFCGCAEAARRDSTEEIETAIHGSLFWDTLNSVWRSKSLDGKGS